MSVVKELIRKEPDGSISFGDYTLASKTKKDDFEHDGDIYKIKTFKEITKLEKNEMMVYESIPGSSVMNLVQKDDEVSFTVEAEGDLNITLEMAPDTEYDVQLGGTDAGRMKTNFSGKLSIGIEADAGAGVSVLIKKA